MGCCYYNNKVYVLGGWHTKFLKEVERYDIATDSWEELSPLPAVSGYGMCLGLKDNIIYVAYRPTSIIVYSITSNSYTMHGDFGYHSNIILANQRDKTYVFDNSSLYKANEDCSSFTKVNSNLPIYGCSLARGILKDKNFYCISSHDSNIYKFDFRTESVALIRKL